MIDKTRKVIYIIVGCLTILSLVFCLAKKVGLCASSEVVSDRYYLNSFPYPVSWLIGSRHQFSSADRQVLLNYANGLSYNSYSIHIIEDGTDSVQLKIYQNPSQYVYPNTTGQNMPRPVFNSSDFYIRVDGYSLIEYSFIDSSIRLISSSNTRDFVFLSKPTIRSDSYGLYIPLFTFMYNEPLFISSGNFSSYEVTWENVSISITGHTKGAVLSNYLDSIEDIENNSDLPSVDVSSPSDPNSNIGWFQKILNGLKTLGDLIKGGVLTIGDFIGNGIQSLKDHIETMTSNIQQSIQLVIDNFNEKFSDLRDWIQGVKDKVEEIADYLKDAFSLPTSEQVAELLNQFLVGTTFGQFLGISNQAVQIIGSVFGQNIPEFETLVFTFNIDFFGQTFPLVLDFGFYTSSVRNTVVGVFLTFFYIGFLIHIIHQLPSIISGSSGVEKDISPIVKDQVKHTRWNMGLHN